MNVATKKFQELMAWKKVHLFALPAYKYSESIPKTEIYGLGSQFRRAAGPIATNSAEGYKKKGKAGKPRMINVAQESLEECQYYLILSKDLGYGHTDKLILFQNEVSKMLESYISKILSSNSQLQSSDV